MGAATAGRGCGLAVRIGSPRFWAVRMTYGTIMTPITITVAVASKNGERHHLRRAGSAGTGTDETAVLARAVAVSSSNHAGEANDACASSRASSGVTSLLAKRASFSSNHCCVSTVIYSCLWVAYVASRTEPSLALPD